MLSRRLVRRGYEVLLAANGQLGVSMALSAKPDLILMDMSLPVMDGWEATRLLKNDRRTAAIPVIALTAHAMVGDRDKAMAAGCDDYDTKPIELPRLLQKIERLLSQSAKKTELPVPPTVAPQAPVAQPPSSEANSDRAVPHILIVDDNEMNCDMLSRRLKKAGYETAIAMSAMEGLALLEQQSVSLVLLDVMMPGMNGLEMLVRLRQKYTQRDLPVIMATARDRSEDVLEAFELGANDYITKPIDLPLALARIQSHLRTAQNLKISEIGKLDSLNKGASEAIAKETDVQVPVSTILLEQYEIIQKIKEESGRSIYVAEDTEDPCHTPYIVEQIKIKPEYSALLELPDLLWHSEIQGFEQFAKDAPIARLIKHSALEGHYCFVKERIQGQSLKDEIYAHKGIVLRKILSLAIELLEILVSFQEKYIVHQNLQPTSFIRRTADRRLILDDFGIFERLNVTLEIHLNPASQNFRTHLSAYTSPEQYQGIILPTCDIYAVGMIIIEAITRMNPSQLKKDPNTGEVNWESQVSVGNELSYILNKAIARNPKHRYKSAKEVLEDIYKLPMVAMFRGQGRSLS